MARLEVPLAPDAGGLWRPDDAPDRLAPVPPSSGGAVRGDDPGDHHRDIDPGPAHRPLRPISAQSGRSICTAVPGAPVRYGQQGRDVFSRILYGGRITLLVRFLAMAVSLIIGTLVGAAAGFFGGTLDGVLMRATDFFLIFPQIFVLLFLSYLLRQANVQFFVGGFGNIVLVIAVTWMVVARLVRAAFLKLREEEYVDAARAW